MYRQSSGKKPTYRPGELCIKRNRASFETTEKTRGKKGEFGEPEKENNRRRMETPPGEGKTTVRVGLRGKVASEGESAKRIDEKRSQEKPQVTSKSGTGGKFWGRPFNRKWELRIIGRIKKAASFWVRGNEREGADIVW